MSLCLAAALLLATADPDEIMRKMAANLDSSLAARRQYVYHQTVKARLIKTNGDPARSERREYTAMPGPERTEKKLESLAGEYYKSKKEIIRYDQPGFEKGGMDIDGGLIKDLIEDLADSKKSRDGIPHSLFPFRAGRLDAYRFTYLAAAEIQGRPTHRIAFEPRNKKANCLVIGDDDDDDDDDCQAPWKGEAWIDAEDLQPVRLFTDSTFRMPRAVKMLLGTNVQQIGFNINYTRVAPGVWFPSTYGTEFRVDVLFRYKRVITLSLESKEFRKTTAESEIRYDVPPPATLVP